MHRYSFCVAACLLSCCSLHADQMYVPIGVYQMHP